MLHSVGPRQGSIEQYCCSAAASVEGSLFGSCLSQACQADVFAVCIRFHYNLMVSQGAVGSSNFCVLHTWQMSIVTSASSSSSTGAAPVPAPSVAVQPRVLGTPCLSKRCLAMVPHVGRFSLQKERGADYIYDEFLLHKQKLPEGVWELEELSGFYALVDTREDSGRCILVEDLMTKTLWKDEASSELLESVKLDDGSLKWNNLTSLMARSRCVEAVFVTGPLHQKISFEGWQVYWPRGSGSRYLWSLPAMYKLLGLSTYSGQASKWAFDNHDRWCKRISLLGGSGRHLFRTRLCSRQMSCNTDPLEGVLPQPSVTTIGLLTLLSSWAFASTQSGGLRTENRRAAAKEILTGIIRSAAQWQPFKVAITVDNSWKIVWPRSRVAAVDCVLHASADGCVSLTPMLECPNPSCPASYRLWRELLRRSGVSADVNLSELLGATVGSTRVCGLFAQIIYWVSIQVERVLFLSLSREKPGPHALSCGTVDLLSLIWKRKELDYQLLKHTVAGQAATQGHSRQHMVVDEANIGGPTIHNAFISLPNGVGFPGVPQATGCFSATQVFVLG